MADGAIVPLNRIAYSVFRFYHPRTLVLSAAEGTHSIFGTS